MMFSGLMLPTLMVWAAEDGKESNVPAAAPDMFSGAYLFEVFISLLMIAGLLFVVLWTLRRFSNGSSFSRVGGNLRVLSSVGLGQRERAVLVLAGDKQILLGVAPGSVTSLHVFDVPVVIDMPKQDKNNGAVPPSFAELWKRVMGNRGG